MSPIVTEEIGDKRPRAVKAWDKKYARTRQICGEQCPERDHGEYRFVPVCDRSPGHRGMCSHERHEAEGLLRAHAWLPKRPTPRRRMASDSKPRGPF